MSFFILKPWGKLKHFSSTHLHPGQLEQDCKLAKPIHTHNPTTKHPTTGSSFGSVPSFFLVSKASFPIHTLISDYFVLIFIGFFFSKFLQCSPKLLPQRPIYFSTQNRKNPPKSTPERTLKKIDNWNVHHQDSQTTTTSKPPDLEKEKCTKHLSDRYSNQAIIQSNNHWEAQPPLTTETLPGPSRC